MRLEHGTWRTRLTIILAGLGLMALLAGCGVSAGARKSVPTAAPLPQSRLTWQPMKMPPQASTIPYTFAFAPSDGDVVYACAVDPQASAQQLHLWGTRDRSAHWTHLADLTVHAGSNNCSLTVADWQPATAVVAVNWAPRGASPQVFNYASYATFDGGITWRQLIGPQPYLVRQLAAFAGVTYADILVLAAGAEQDEIVTSSDQLRTWQPLPQTQSFGLGGSSSGMWLNPKNGALLAEGTAAAGAGLWSSDDGGMHWTAISTPLSPTNLSLAAVVVQTPRAGEPWHLCVAASAPDNRTPSNSLTCTSDGGQTWTTRPALNVAFSNPPKGTFYAPATVFAIDDNGAALAWLPDFAAARDTFYRLAPQARQWQVIGSIVGEAFPVGLYPTATGDILWADGQPVIGESNLAQGWQFASYS